MSQLLRTILLTLLLTTSTATFAATYTLSGGPSSGANLGNDDTVVVYVNGFQVGTVGCCDNGPITFSAEPGDTLRVTVEDTGGNYHINPLYLHSGSGSTILDAVGVPPSCCDAGLFYDQTFTVPAPHTVPTLSEWSMIILSSLLALGAIVAMRRQRQ